MLKKIITLLIISFATIAAHSKADVNLDEQYQPDTYTRYDLRLEKENLNISAFKIIREEPHLNPVYFDVYFQCAKSKSYYKLVRDFGEYESEITYCGNNKPIVEKIKDKVYLSLPLRRATPETGCPDKVNRKEVFSVAQIKEHCAKVASLK